MQRRAVNAEQIPSHGTDFKGLGQAIIPNSDRFVDQAAEKVGLALQALGKRRLVISKSSYDMPAGDKALVRRVIDLYPFDGPTTDTILIPDIYAQPKLFKALELLRDSVDKASTGAVKPAIVLHNNERAFPPEVTLTDLDLNFQSSIVWACQPKP